MIMLSSIFHVKAQVSASGRADGVSVTLAAAFAKCHCYTMTRSITIKELHATTGEHVRRAGASRSAVLVTDRGETVAAIVNPSQLKPRRRRRVLLDEFEALMARKPGSDVLEDLDAVRGEP